MAINNDVSSAKIPAAEVSNDIPTASDVADASNLTPDEMLEQFARMQQQMGGARTDGLVAKSNAHSEQSLADLVGSLNTKK